MLEKAGLSKLADVLVKITDPSNRSLLAHHGWHNRILPFAQ